MWVGLSNRTMSSSRAPQVNGTYLPMPFLEGGVLWYGPGTAPDAITAFTAGTVLPEVSLSTQITPTFRAVPMWVTPLLYAPGSATDVLVTGAQVIGSYADLLGITGSINGTYRTGTTHSGPVTVLHAPGPASDQLMFSLPEAAAASEGPTDWGHLRQRGADAATTLTAG
jgi:hypothetical protein